MGFLFDSSGPILLTFGLCCFGLGCFDLGSLVLVPWSWLVSGLVPFGSNFGFLGVATWIDYRTDFATLGRAFNCHSCICNSIGFVRCVEGTAGLATSLTRTPFPTKY